MALWRAHRASTLAPARMVRAHGSVSCAMDGGTTRQRRCSCCNRPHGRNSRTEHFIMKRMLVGAAVALAALAAAGGAEAKGCIKGAIVGGIAGHYAGHHGLVGAAAGCAIGRHRANARDRQVDQQQMAPQARPGLRPLSAGRAEPVPGMTALARRRLRPARPAARGSVADLPADLRGLRRRHGRSWRPVPDLLVGPAPDRGAGLPALRHAVRRRSRRRPAALAAGDRRPAGLRARPGRRPL